MIPENESFLIFTIIATSLGRTRWLLERSLPSVYKQKKINPARVKIVVVDDNVAAEGKRSREFDQILEGIKRKRELFDLQDEDFATVLLSNKRTKYNSGTGAWNTGIQYIKKMYGVDNYFSILDDDDEYLCEHLWHCFKAIFENGRDKRIGGVFCRIIWKTGDVEFVRELTADSLTSCNFFIGNPGVQGSNMFFSTEIIDHIGGFDENLPNTTDRDIMIRFLNYIEQYNRVNSVPITAEVVEKPMVRYYNHSEYKVNNDFDRKKAGLDLFYAKYKSFFSREDYEKSLIRAGQHFRYGIS